MDLFSGSGGIGIEALSRGRQGGIFVEAAQNGGRLYRVKILKKTHLERNRRCSYVPMFLRRCGVFRPQKRRWILFLWIRRTMNLLKRMCWRCCRQSPLADASTLIIVEADLSADFSYADSLGFDIIREKKYKTNKHMFLMKKQDGEKV